jgi:MoaA/NifB/PqqE/SkfB family radical SAM enzyme
MSTYIKQDDKPILRLSAPIRKVALWHITKRCNVECKYCYGTFHGSSYKKNIAQKDFSLDAMLSVVDLLNKSGINRIHLCGGEPFLYNEFLDLLKYIRTSGIESFVLTNLTFLPEYIEKLFTEQFISNLSFSLDSLDKGYNTYVRGVHDIVINNVEKIVQYKNTSGSSVELGLYIVATKKNLAFLIPLIDWAIKKGINYVTLQAVYLPNGHKHYEELSLSRNDLKILENVFEYLLSCEDKIRVSGTLLHFITNILISKKNLSVENCFVEHNSQYYFIDGDGNIKTCTTKKNIVGCINRGLYTSSVQNSTNQVCSEFCLDCIGIWEMVYPKEVNSIIEFV